ncbi:unnamed protein product [Rotaria sp. Silwood1]|nr:unnamed protein product [Rotaria sp. Silwood1]
MASKPTISDMPTSGRKLALVIGIWDYQNENVRKLTNPGNDATDITCVLERIGFSVTTKLNLTYWEMAKICDDFRKIIQRGDMVLFYYAGHGKQWKEQNYLLPIDYDDAEKNLNKNAIPVDSILYDFSDREPFVTIFLLDCCREYHVRNDNIDTNTRGVGNTDSKSSGFKAMDAQAGSLIAFACAPGTIANDGEGERNGIFTKYLLKHLPTPNEDIRMILADVTKEVMIKSGTKQIPFLSAALIQKHVYLCGQPQKQPQDFLQISDNDLKLDEEIGRGAFGVVYRAQWLSRHDTVAVKKLHLTQLDKQAEKDFFKELLLMHSIHYPHIITFYGACTEHGKYALVMEYMSLGSLYKILHKDKEPLNWSQRLSIALQTAKGINYLHKLEPPILHRDIKSSNFLLETSHDDYIVKVCDFGLAQTRNETTRQSLLTHAMPCTLQWTAPEILRMKKHTNKSDVYSLGIVYWELAANEIPYDGHESGNIREFVLSGDRLEIPETAPIFLLFVENMYIFRPCG